MKVGIAVFAYNRSRHLKKVLNGLSKNEGISKLYIFQDGLKCEGHREEWKKTRVTIKEIDWCRVSYYQSSHNKGLAKSIVDGVNIVFQENDAVIVLEDDCVPADNFITFMRQCFDKYDDDKRVYSISGYTWSIDLLQDEYDVYGCGRFSSWGWGTWKDRWKQYKVDNNIINRLKVNQKSSRYLAIWGNDCEQMLIDRIGGKNDSWAIYWTLNIIENKGICINPYKSLINNIGMDGTGVHCGVNRNFPIRIFDDLKQKFILPARIELLKSTEESFVSLYGGYTAIHNKNELREKVLIYGLGNFFATNERELNDLYDIKAFIDAKKTGWYAGKKIICIDEISLYQYDKIIVMIQKFQECSYVFHLLVDKGIEMEKIVLGHSCLNLERNQ